MIQLPKLSAFAGKSLVALLASFWAISACTPLQASSGVEHVVPNLAALSGKPSVVLPPPPAWVADRQDSLWSIADVTANFEKSAKNAPQVHSGRVEFVRPDLQWLVAYVKWFRRLDKPLSLHYVDELWNCANFSRCFSAFADLLAQKGGETRGSICIGWATVYNRTPFADVREGGQHSIVIAGTSDGLYVIEPQNGTMVALRDYPNRDEFAELNF